MPVKLLLQIKVCLFKDIPWYAEEMFLCCNLILALKNTHHAILYHILIHAVKILAFWKENVIFVIWVAYVPWHMDLNLDREQDSNNLVGTL
jgi:hypothetical protein